MIDYVTLMLINMAAGLAMLAVCVVLDFGQGNPKRWAAGFAIVGAVATICGLHMTFNWPIIGAYNMAFGEMSVLFGVLFLGAALAFGKGWDLLPVAIYAFFAGLAAIAVGIKMAKLGMTQTPQVTATGYVLTGVAGICTLPALYLRRYRLVLVVGAIVLGLAALIWFRTALLGYWAHLEMLSDYKPASMK